ncbi:MAG: DUF1638 domain-containing protein [Candidatus Methanomethylophilaceae archaeon]|jgi:hypothetical protein
MTSGVLTIIGCPILEDELVYNLRKDTEEKDIYLVEAEPSKSLKAKLDRYGIPYTEIDGRAFNNGLETFDPSRFSIVIKMMTLGLHAEPKDLRAKIEEEITDASASSGAIAVYYGMCGNYGWDISKWAEEKGLCPVVVFRDNAGRVCDDCVGIAVGGLDKYRELIKAHTGQMLFTPAVATNWEDFMAANEMFKGMPEGDTDMMKWIFDLCGYDTVVKIDTGLGDRTDMDHATEDFAKTYNFKIIEGDEKWPCIYPAERIYSEAKQILDS